MSIAAYNRGSLAIARSIEREYLQKGGRERGERDTLERAERSIRDLEEFCLRAQAFFVDIQCESSATGLVAGGLHSVYARKRNTKKMEQLLSECLHAHCQWLDSDVQYSLNHLQACRRKAKAWKAVFDYLNPAPRFRLPFSTPVI